MNLRRLLLGLATALALAPAPPTLAAASAPAPAPLPEAPLPSGPVVASKSASAVGQLVARMLEEVHYSHRPIDAAISRQALDNYIDAFDFNHLIFDKADVDRFRTLYGGDLGGRLKAAGDVAPAYEIFNLFVRRLEERVSVVRELAASKFDFGKDESIAFDRHEAPWPATPAESAELWRLRVKYEILQERLNKTKPEDQAKNVVQRYERMLRSVKEYDSDDVLQAYLTSLTRAYDPHSEYLEAAEKKNFDITMKLSLVGIGAVLRSEDGYPKVVSLVPGGPADVDKRLKPNDRIESVAQGDGPFEEIVGMKLDRAVQLIRGEKGTKVRLKIIPADARDPSTRVIIPLIRDQIKLVDMEAKAKVVEVPAGARTARLGVIDLPSFYSDAGGGAGGKSTTRDLARLIDGLQEKGVEGIVIDLRRNGGGSLAEAIALTELFIGEGPVVQVKDSRGRVKVLGTTKPEPSYGGPVILLTSRMSASAAEIFAGALQDYGRAVVVGDKSTFGKGTVQSVQELAEYLPPSIPEADAGALKVTIEKFYRVSGASTQNRGVLPDLHLPSVDDELDIAESSQKNALPYDEVAPARYVPFNAVGVFLPRLRNASAARVSASPEFAYIREDAARARQDSAKKTISLNEKARLAEQQADKDRQDKRGRERLARGAKPFQSEEVTLESLDGTAPPPKAAPAVSASTSAETASYEKLPPAPDAALDESLLILRDLLHPGVEAASIPRPEPAPAPK